MKPLSAGIFFLVILASLTPFVKMAIVRILKNLRHHHTRNMGN
jgi:hypothetical protein